jgi:hypothetical protein
MFDDAFSTTKTTFSTLLISISISSIARIIHPIVHRDADAGSGSRRARPIRACHSGKPILCSVCSFTCLKILFCSFHVVRFQKNFGCFFDDDDGDGDDRFARYSRYTAHRAYGVADRQRRRVGILRHARSTERGTLFWQHCCYCCCCCCSFHDRFHTIVDICCRICWTAQIASIATSYVFSDTLESDNI